MPTTFLLVKFFDTPDHADAFENGLVYMNRLGYFKTIENEYQDSPAAKIGMRALQDGSNQAKEFLDINGVRIQDAQIQIQKHWLDDLHVFCMHAMHSGDLDLDRLAATNDVERLRRQLRVPPQCVALGNNAVVIKDVSAFCPPRNASGLGEDVSAKVRSGKIL